MNYEKVNKLLDAAYGNDDIVGISMAVSDKGKHTWYQAGYSDYEAKKPVTKDTVFPIASCTKSFMAVAASILAQKGVLSLDEPLRTYYPELCLVDKYAEIHITMRDLLCHRSGLPRHDIAWAAHINNGLTAQEIVHKLKYLPPFTSFRNKFAYNNMCYTLAGQVAERVTGKLWDELMKKEIFEKLGIKNISCQVKALDSHADKALRHVATVAGDENQTRIIKTAPYNSYDANGPASCINISMAELIKWVDAQMDCSGAQLDSTALKETHTPHMFTGISSGHPGVDMRSFGLGWFIERYKGKKMIYHTGAVEGFVSIQFFVPEIDFGGCIASNLTGMRLHYMYALMYALTDLHVGENPDFEQICQWLSPSAPKQPEAPDITFAPSLDLDAYVGEYAHGGYGNIFITRQQEGLRSKFGNFELNLVHETQNNFKLKHDDYTGVNFPVQFVTDLHGVVMALDTQLEPAISEPARFIKKG